MLTSLIFLLNTAQADVISPGQERCDGVRECGALPIVSCQSSYHGEETPDCAPYKGAGYRFACDSGGATVSTAYYCKVGDAPLGPALGDAPAATIPEVVSPPAPPTPTNAVPTPQPARCATAPETSLAGLGVALLLLARRRR